MDPVIPTMTQNSRGASGNLRLVGLLNLADMFRAFSEGSTLLLAGVLPSIIAREAYAGREGIVKGFKEYFSAKGHESGSQLIKARWKSMREYDLSLDDISRLEACNGFGILINTLPTAFWEVYHIFSDAQILASVRELASPLVTTSKRDNGSPLYTLDVRKIREISLLVSILNESLRFHASGAAARMIMEDFMLDGRYLLKKDSMLMVPNREIHFHRDTWGENVDEFDHFRFMRNKVGGSKTPPAGAFRGFGSGVNICPGKSFATTEILAVAVMMSLRFDITPVSGSWTYPGDDGRNMSTVICTPKDPVPVKISSRKAWATGTWVFKAMD
jgi:cytochrome P450